MPENYEELARRCEEATGEMQGRLIEEAWETCAEHSAEFRRYATAHLSGFDNNAGKFSMALEAGAYESAAMMLVPEGLSFEVRSSGTGDKGQATVWDPMRAPGMREWRVTGCATPALALCAASLRARAAEHHRSEG